MSARIGSSRLEPPPEAHAANPAAAHPATAQVLMLISIPCSLAAALKRADLGFLMAERPYSCPSVSRPALRQGLAQARHALPVDFRRNPAHMIMHGAG